MSHTARTRTRFDRVSGCAAQGPQGLIVLGAGVAGLAASMRCGAPVHEASAQVGGAAASDSAGAFTFDRGIHILQTQSEEILGLLRELGVDLVQQRRNAHIYSHGRYTAYPFQVNTAGLPLGLRARCVWTFLRRERGEEPTHYEDWIYQNLGRGFGDTFLIPYSEKFWTVHPRELTCEWAGNRVPTPSVLQVLRGAVLSRQTNIGTNTTFYYPARGAGYGSIPLALSHRSGKIHLGSRATRIDTARRRIEFGPDSAADYSVLISSLPLPELVRIAADAPPEVRRAAERLRTNSIFIVNLAIDGPDVSDRHWVHFPEPDVSFFRISYPHNLGAGVAPPGTSSISAEVPYSAATPLDRKNIVERVIDDLQRTGALPRGRRIIATTTHDIEYAYCIYDMQRRAAVRTIHDWLDRVDIIPCGRYGLWNYFWSDQSLMSGIKAAEHALRRMGLRPGAELGDEPQ